MELQIHKWIHKEFGGVDYDWRYNEETEEQDVLCWIDFDELPTFVKLFNIKSIDMLSVNLQETSIAVFVGELCDSINVDINQIFEKS